MTLWDVVILLMLIAIAAGYLTYAVARHLLFLVNGDD